MMDAVMGWYREHGAVGDAWQPTGCVARHFGNPAAETEAGRARALIVDRSRCARLQLTGKDRRELVQNLTTNDVLKVPEGKGVATTFTTGKGRIVDRVVLHAASDGDLLIGNADRASALVEWMEKYIIREDVQQADLTEATVMLDVVGPRAAELCHAPLVAFADLHELMILELAGVSVLAMKTDAVAGLTVRLVVPATHAIPLLEFLMGRGGVLGGSDAYNVLRLEAGMPLYGPELNEEHNPLEAGLVDTLHFSKGCYVGQEVVARVDTYMKQRRYLVALEVEGAPPAPGARLSLPNGDEGEVTSAADTGNGRSRMLGYLKTQDPFVGLDVQLDEEGLPRRTAVVVRRPAQAPAPKGGEGNQCSVVV
jgi:folate-binding protein YgfZ